PSYRLRGSRHHNYTHPFPTRRSSDLVHGPGTSRRGEGRSPLRPVQPRLRALPHGYGRSPFYGREHDGPAAGRGRGPPPAAPGAEDRKSTRLNSSHVSISYAVFCLKKK